MRKTYRLNVSPNVFGETARACFEKIAREFDARMTFAQIACREGEMFVLSPLGVRRGLLKGKRISARTDGKNVYAVFALATNDTPFAFEIIVPDTVSKIRVVRALHAPAYLPKNVSDDFMTFVSATAELFRMGGGRLDEEQLFDILAACFRWPKAEAERCVRMLAAQGELARQTSAFFTWLTPKGKLADAYRNFFRSA